MESMVMTVSSSGPVPPANRIPSPPTISAGCIARVVRFTRPMVSPAGTLGVIQVALFSSEMTTSPEIRSNLPSTAIVTPAAPSTSRRPMVSGPRSTVGAA
jgi:hypothetical protein